MIAKESRQRHSLLVHILDGHISDYVSRTTASAILELEKYSQEFFLTGSRFFGTHMSRSDFDFYVAYSNGLASDLEAIGFEEAHDPSYDDALTEHVLGKGMVHVQLVKDIVLKARIQRALDKNCVMQHTGRDKHLHRVIWSAMIEASLGEVAGKPVVQVVPAGKYCSCPGEKVKRTTNGRDYYQYCKGCNKEYIP